MKRLVVLLAAMLFALLIVKNAIAANTEKTDKQDLLALYELAKQNDPMWAAAQKDNQAAHERIVQGKALMLPTLGVSANANHTNADIQYTGQNNVFRNGGNEQFETYGVNLNASQPLYRPQNKIQYKQSKIRADYSDQQLSTAEQDLMQRISQAYFDLLIAQDKIYLINAQKKATKLQLKKAEKNFKVGVSTITDVNDAKAKLDLLLAQEVSALNAVESKKNALEAITKKRVQSIATVQSSFKPVMDMPNTMDAWVAKVLDQNPKLHAQKKLVALAKKEVDLNHAGHLPTVDVVGSYSYTDANGGINGFGNKLNNFQIGLQLNLPLYQGGAIDSKEREAFINYKKTMDKLEQVKQQLILETRQAWLDLKTSMYEIKAYQQAVASSESQVKSTAKAYMVGLRNTVDVLDAQQQLFASKHNFNVARYTYLNNMIKLKTATGVITQQDIVMMNGYLK